MCYSFIYKDIFGYIQKMTIFKNIFAFRKPQYAMAHEIPLNLFNCEYELDNKEWIIDEDSLLKVIQSLQREWTILAAK